MKLVFSVARGPRAALSPFLAALVLAATASAEVRLPAFYGSGMVLQRGQEIRLRGWADAGEAITVTQDGRSVSTVADADGRWRAGLPAREAGPMPPITIKGGNTVVLDDLLAGDVWLCAGQSNMEFRLRRAEGGAEAARAANFPRIRLFTVGRKVAYSPTEELTGEWQPCTPENAERFSAVGFYFGRDLHEELKVPVGLVFAAWGGTPGEAWVAEGITRPDADYAALYAEWADYRANYPAIKAKLEADLARWEERAAKARAEGRRIPPKPLSKPDPDNNHQYPGALYNGMIHPLAGLPIKGVAWYQGETNTKRAGQYRKLLGSLITDWRARWGLGDFPFLVVSLANFHKPDAEPPDYSPWAALREAQAAVAGDLPAVGLAVAIDLGQSDDIHPLNKRDVGRRLMLAALGTAYGREGVFSGPAFAGLRAEGGEMRIRFRDTGSGLVARGGEEGGGPGGFAIAGDDGKWRWARARIEGDEVVLSHPDVPRPARARYGWADNPGATLYNREGLPAAPFRADGE